MKKNNKNNDMDVKILRPENYSTKLLCYIRQTIGISDVDMDTTGRRCFDPNMANQIQIDASKSLQESLEKLESMQFITLTTGQNP